MTLRVDDNAAIVAAVVNVGALPFEKTLLITAIHHIFDAGLFINLRGL